MNKNISEVSTLNLLIEFMYQGKAEIIDEISHLEPFEVSEILKVLKTRVGQDYGQDFNSWFNWFIDKNNRKIKEEEKENLRLLKANKERDDFYIKKIKGPDKAW